MDDGSVICLLQLLRRPGRKASRVLFSASFQPQEDFYTFPPSTASRVCFLSLPFLTRVRFRLPFPAFVLYATLEFFKF
jgi:hypothetical protein